MAKVEKNLNLNNEIFPFCSLVALFFCMAELFRKSQGAVHYKWPDFWSVERLQIIIYNSSTKNFAAKSRELSVRY